MSVFQRRTRAAAGAPPEGVRAAPYSAPVPLLSMGVAALDDILCGGGVLAGSVVLFVPCAETGTASPAELGAPAAGGAARAAFDAPRTAAAEPYTDLFLGYTAAQGLASRHVTVVVGPHASSFVGTLMGRATDDAVTEEAAPAEQMQDMKIAWRYNQMQRVAAPPVRAKEAAFCSVFDLTKQIPSDEVARARADGLLYTSADDAPLADTAWATIEQGVAQCRTQTAAQGTPAPALRIVLRDWGSSAWGIHASSMVPFLLRLRTLARTLSMPTSGTPVPCIVAASLSAELQTHNAHGANLVHRLTHLADGAIGLTSFAASPALRDVFPDTTGALRVFRTPSIGTLTNPSLRASVLRGMGAGSAAHPTRGAGGAGGGENNLAFKVRRKRLVIDTLHLDTDGGVRERRTKPSEDAPTHTTTPTPRAASTAETPTAQRAAAASAPAAAPAPAPASVEVALDDTRAARLPREAPMALPPFAGLERLRERGLRARAELGASTPPQTYEM
ncbi:Elongator subunit elp4 [Malassezia brasiliensis]|uniref:Elongator complex protein 4 n=1 Tax=Malassezia brasiliensis TaxID=1821822 RepID=A0AAF0DVY7_9BASI|nr:Elongator subunit elp4 [Malassezia brasiliensis]